MAALIRTILDGLKALWTFACVVILGVIAALILALPWLARIAALLAWLLAAAALMDVLRGIYAPFTPAVPLYALQGAVILAAVSWLGILIRRARARERVWGGLALGGLAMSGLAWLLGQTYARYGDLPFRVLPPALFAAMLIYLTARGKSIRKGGFPEEKEPVPAPSAD